jgi:hypothetical protein
MADIDDRIDQLYQLPLDQFTPARNALAKELKRPAIKELEKPNAAAWAVNQLYWQQKATFDRLLKAAERLRGEHRKLLAGKSSDVREAESAHREAIRDSLDRVRSLLTGAGQAPSPATLNAVQETLEALPSGEQHGRLVRPLKPLGFEALSGVSIKPNLRVLEKPRAKASGDDDESGAARTATKVDRVAERRLAKQREKEERERKERQREAERTLKAAEGTMLRAEDAVKKAEKALMELRAERDKAVSEYQRARLRAHE